MWIKIAILILKPAWKFVDFIASRIQFILADKRPYRTFSQTLPERAAYFCTGMIKKHTNKAWFYYCITKNK